jgi:four helix bundle protein
VGSFLSLTKRPDVTQQGKRQKAKGKRQKERGRKVVDEGKPRDIVERTYQFALAIVQMCEACERRNNTARTLARQLLRSGTSIGANVEEAQAGQSRADFISKYAIALKEARETRYWMRLLIDSGKCPREIGAPLREEAEELKRIIGAIIVNTKKNIPAN